MRIAYDLKYWILRRVRHFVQILATSIQPPCFLKRISCSPNYTKAL